MAILCCICVWHAIIPLIDSSNPSYPDQTEMADMIALGILASIYVAFHVVFIVVIVSLVG